ncbi:putative Fe-S cluster protein YjdI [Exiguobacterium sp. PvP048]
MKKAYEGKDIIVYFDAEVCAFRSLCQESADRL